MVTHLNKENVFNVVLTVKLLVKLLVLLLGLYLVVLHVSNVQVKLLLVFQDVQLQAILHLAKLALNAQLVLLNVHQ